MTVLTKSSDKKKLLPIPTAPVSPPSPSRSQLSDGETARIIHARQRARATTMLVFLMAVLVLLMGILAGLCFYRQYLKEKIHRLECLIPYTNDVDREETIWLNTHWNDKPRTFSDSLKMDRGQVQVVDDDGIKKMLTAIFKQFQRDFNDDEIEPEKEFSVEKLNDEEINKKWFKEKIEIKDDKIESYADIRIPDFHDGRRGRFIHDYKNNQTSIIDEDAKRCFVYPLDYSTTLPPKSMTDVFMKMQSGYYFPDTSLLRKKMRVVIPALDHDDDFISPKTLQLCKDMNIYRLEPFVGGVFKRSIGEKLNEHAVFAEYAGKQIVEYDFMNLNDVEEYENGKKPE